VIIGRCRVEEVGLEPAGLTDALRSDRERLPCVVGHVIQRISFECVQS